MAGAKETPGGYRFFVILLIFIYLGTCAVCFFIEENGFRLKYSNNVQHSVGVVKDSGFGNFANRKIYQVSISFPDSEQRLHSFVDNVGVNVPYEINQSVKVLYDNSGDMLVAKIEDNMGGVAIYTYLLSGMLVFFLYLSFLSVRRARELERELAPKLPSGRSRDK